jgi:hypothetical protein
VGSEPQQHGGDEGGQEGPGGEDADQRIARATCLGF